MSSEFAASTTAISERVDDERALAIKACRVSKTYQIYEKSSDRLKQFILPRLARRLGAGGKSYFSEFRALEKVSLFVEKGEVVGIVGKNGSGKSTLLQIICGTVSQTEGHVEVFGRIAALLELGSGFNPDFTGKENVYLNAAILGLSAAEIDARYESIVRFADIGDFINQPVKTYSSGMAVRLAFSVAVNVDPEILIVDEALSVGDELFQRKCFARIQEIRDRGATILFVSHSAGAVIELCDRAILLDEGELLAQGDPKSIINIYQKLLYSDPGKRLKLRESIKEKSVDFYRNEAAEEISEVVENVVESLVEGPEIFMPELVPAAAAVYEGRGACIHGVAITTLTGDRVNGLVRGRSYLYRYKVDFDKDVRKVRFGMQIKTKSGMPLGSALSSADPQDAIALLRKGDSAMVEFEFDIPLNPGVYFMNAGVFGFLEEEETLIHRISDAAAFLVLPVPQNRAHEIVDFGCKPRITING